LLDHNGIAEGCPMRTHLFLLPLLVVPALAACSVQQDRVSAYTIDEPSPAVLDGTCRSVADTGDMYRYCMEYGPQQAMAVPR
jgi:hypothetical protein